MNDLRSLDPERREPGYWSLFQIRVLALASPELERRRNVARGGTTVSSVVTAWSKTVVPAAMAAAAAAILFIAGGTGVTSAVVESQPARPVAEVASDGGPSSPFEDETQLTVILSAAVDGFWASIRGSRHEVRRVWSDASSSVCEGTCTYTRHDGSTVTIPFVDVLYFRDGRAEKYYIYMDAAPLWT